MSAAFTPGPWELRVDPYEDDPFPGQDFFILRFGDCAVTGITEPANARLIAAAPDLYAALESILTDQGCTEGDKCPHWVWFHKVAREALAKARGEA